MPAPPPVLLRHGAAAGGAEAAMSRQATAVAVDTGPAAASVPAAAAEVPTDRELGMRGALLRGERRLQGHVKSFNHQNGFGFIACTEVASLFGGDVFLHRNKVETGEIVKNKEVSFLLRLNKEGKPQAHDAIVTQTPTPVAFPSAQPTRDDSEFPAGRIYVGKVKSWCKEKGFGFISCNETWTAFGRDVFVHHSILAGFDVGEVVRFRICVDPFSGAPKCRDLEPASRAVAVSNPFTNGFAALKGLFQQPYGPAEAEASSPSGPVAPQRHRSSRRRRAAARAKAAAQKEPPPALTALDLVELHTHGARTPEDRDEEVEAGSSTAGGAIAGLDIEETEGAWEDRPQSPTCEWRAGAGQKHEEPWSARDAQRPEQHCLAANAECECPDTISDSSTQQPSDVYSLEGPESSEVEPPRVTEPGTNSGADTTVGPAWQQYRSEDGSDWWWCQADGDWFVERDPGLWKKFADPGSGRFYWWKADDKWFWV